MNQKEKQGEAENPRFSRRKEIDNGSCASSSNSDLKEDKQIEDEEEGGEKNIQSYGLKKYHNTSPLDYMKYERGRPQISTQYLGQTLLVGFHPIK